MLHRTLRRLPVSLTWIALAWLLCLAGADDASAQICKGDDCVDVTSPTIAISPQSMVYGGTSAPSATISITVCDFETIASVSVQFGGSSVTPTWSMGSGSGCGARWTTTLTRTLTAGTQSLVVTATDGVNPGTTQTGTYTWDPTLDAQLPTVTVTITPVAPPSAGNHADSAAAVVVRFTDDQALALSSRSITLNGTAVSLAQSAGDGVKDVTYSGTVRLAAGNNTVTASVRDAFGNGPVSRSTSYFHDRTPPTITLSPVVRQTTDSLFTPTLTFSDEKGLTLGSRRITVNEAALAPLLTSVETPLQHSWSGGVRLAFGESVITSRICDAVGHCTTRADTVFRYKGERTAPEVASASLMETRHPGGSSLAYATPAYFLRDRALSLALDYSSGRAKPVGRVELDVADYSRTTPDRISLTLLNAAGAAVPLYTGTPGVQLPELFFVGGAGRNRLIGQFDAADLATGAYTYIAVVRSWWGDVVEETRTSVRTIIQNGISSPQGAGWAVVGLQRLHLQADGALALNGDGSASFFPTGTCVQTNVVTTKCTYVAPAGEFSQLHSYHISTTGERSYQRVYPDSSAVWFRHDGYAVSANDRSGAEVTTYAYQTVNGLPALSTVTRSTGHADSLTYGSGRLASIRTVGGRTTQVVVNVAGDLQQIVDPDNVQALGVTYDASHRLLSYLDRTGAQREVTYDPAGETETLSEPAVQTVAGTERRITRVRSLASMELPPAGTGSRVAPAPRVAPDRLWIRLWSTGEDSTTFAVDRFGLARERMVDGSVAYTYRNASGQDTLHVAGNGDSLRISWSGSNPTRATLTRVRPDNTWAPELTVQWEHNLANQLVREHGDLPERRYWYGAGGRMDSLSAAGEKTRFAYYPDGRLRAVVGPDGTRDSLAYESGGLRNTVFQRDKAGAITYTRDQYGRVTGERLPAGETSSRTWDLMNRVVTATGPGGRTTTTSFASHNAYVGSITDPKGQIYGFERNVLGWVTAQTDPDGARVASRFRSDAQVGEVVTARGDTIRTQYDAIGRPVRISAGATTTNLSHDDAARTFTVATPEASVTIQYDSLGRKSSEETTRGTVRTRVTWRYDGAGRISRLDRYVGSSWIGRTDYQYDTKGRTSSVSLAGRQGGITYDGQNLPTRLTLPTATADTITLGITSTLGVGSIRYNRTAVDARFGLRITRDSLARPVERRNAAADTLRELRYDSVGQLAATTDYHAPAPVCSYMEHVGTICTGGARTTLRAATFTYDAAGNPTDPGAVVQAGNRLAQYGGYTLSYDVDGNLTRKTRAGYDQRLYWNPAGQLDSVVTNGARTSFGYDGFGRRIRKTSAAGTKWYVYDGHDVVMELDETNAVRRTFAHYPGIDAPFAMRDQRSDQTYFFLRDDQGSVLGLLNESGQIGAQYRYGPWGEAEFVHDTLANGYRYTGRELDTETGLYFYRARYYDPALHRFISKDPLGLAGGVNKYAYLGNVPTVGADPSGMCPGGVWIHYVAGPVSGGDTSIESGAEGWILICPPPSGTQSPIFYMYSGGYGGLRPGARAQPNPDQVQAMKDAALERQQRSQLGRADSIFMLVGVRTRAVQPYLEGYAAASLTYPVAVMAAGGTTGMTVLRLPSYSLPQAEIATGPVMPYRAAQVMVKGFRGDLQGHHILEARHLRFWRLSTQEGPSVVLTRAEHNVFSNALREALPTGVRYSRAQVWQAYLQVYKDYPQLLYAIRHYFVI